ncbi:AraC family transcriptional regulator [Amycolatopsis jiangsuensis]|uniref:AraC-like DNA-binding protein n=1 Tax=Amycolatopsis jiangsuensis TaxID=1181879 RepID=A0A840J5E4_9PSEU|nr:helix-turn-helix transcriptional regulator [Amycolatopsis jiangsuensis]MBB4688652.1 AraC-like DNA-binding protein [Amycolatopsis jiangsuensis]
MVVETGQQVLGVGYAPACAGMAEVRRFPSTGVLRGPVRRHPVRPDFHVVGVLTGGTGAHEVDFRPADLAAGTVFWLRPGQVHRIPDTARLRGALVLFTASALAPGTRVAAFADDVARPSQWQLGPHGTLADAALRHLELLLAEPSTTDDVADALRLALTPLAAAAGLPQEVRANSVFTRFATAVEAEHTRLHHVREYERLVHAGSRTIDRAVRQARGVSAKRFLDERIALEARRRLATSEVTVAALGRELGFSEATNFVKFYRRLTGTTPAAARAAR